MIPRSANRSRVVFSTFRLLKTDSPESILSSGFFLHFFLWMLSLFLKTNTYTECVYRALRTNPQLGCGCETPPPHIDSPCLGPVSCAAAGQRWVTRPVNDTSRLGHKLEQTAVRGRCPVILGCAGPAVVCRFRVCFCVCTGFCVYFWQRFCWIYSTRVVLISVLLGVRAISDLWPYMVSECCRYKDSFCL